MKRPTLAAVFFLVMATGVAEAQATEVGGARRFGLGFAIGEPTTSIVGKYFLNQVNAIDFGIGFASIRHRCDQRPGLSCDRVGFLSLTGDYLWHDVLAREGFKLDWHIGPGGRLTISDDRYGYSEDILIFARMPVGLDLTFQKPEFLEVFLEIAPALLLLPGVSLELEAFLGVRFYF
jgi:hypothetical protein